MIPPATLPCPLRGCAFLLAAAAWWQLAAAPPANGQSESAARIAEFEAVPGVPSLRGEPGSGLPGEVRPDPVRLSLHLRPGRTYRYVGETLFRSEMPGRGLRELRLEQQARIDAAPRADGRPGVSLRVRNERLKIDLRGPGGAPFTFDSLSDEGRSTSLGRHFRSELFRWVELDLNTDLRVVASREEGRAAIDETDDGYGQLPRFGSDELRGLVETLLQGMPDRAVAPGDTWETSGERRLEGGGISRFDLAHRYLGEAPLEGRAIHRVEFAGRLVGRVPQTLGDSGSGLDRDPAAGDDGVPEPATGLAASFAFDSVESAPAEPEGPQIDLPASEIQGEILFDPALGLPREIRQSIRLVLEIPHSGAELGGADAAAPPAPLRVPVQQEQRITFLQESATAG